MKGVYDDINGTLGYQMKIRHFVQLFIYLSGQYTGIPKNMKIFSLWFINVQKALFSVGAAFIQALHAQRNTPAASMIALRYGCTSGGHEMAPHNAGCACHHIAVGY